MRRLLVALILAMAAGGGRADAQDTRRLADHLSALNHISCYPFGLDQIGRGDVSAGIEEWKNCFTPDFKFWVFLGFGQPSECPGQRCDLEGATSIDKRAALARRVYQNAGYVRTSHQLSNQTVTFTGPDTVHVKSYISAWHIKQDGSIVTGVGAWEVDLGRKGEGWLIVNEKLGIVGAGMLQSLRK